MKLTLGSMVPVMSSMVSICSERGQGGRRDACSCHSSRVSTCFLTLSITRSVRAEGYGSSSGAVRSLTQARVKACRSSAHCGILGAVTDARMSEMSPSIVVCVWRVHSARGTVVP